jgi:hypothetical protein
MNQLSTSLPVNASEEENEHKQYPGYGSSIANFLEFIKVVEDVIHNCSAGTCRTPPVRMYMIANPPCRPPIMLIMVMKKVVGESIGKVM